MHHSTRRVNSQVSVMAFVVATLILSPLLLSAAKPDARRRSDPLVTQSTAREVAAEVDRLIGDELRDMGVEPAAISGDEDFLRRVMLDLAGTLPSPNDVTLFGLDPDPNKRSKLIDRLLKGDTYAQTWARYWRDVIYSRATDQRSRRFQGMFEEWMTQQLQEGAGWHEIATELITATGDVSENGATALIFAHGGQAAEIAAETSRIFLGIQMQCANCHDHPTDRWKRKQFHEFAAYFPRIQVRSRRDQMKRTFEIVSFDASRSNRFDFRTNPQQMIKRFDKNGDRKLSKAEVDQPRIARVFERMLGLGDANNDGKLSIAEIRKIPQPNNFRRGSAEHYMPNLDDPVSKGKRVNPVFFVSGNHSSKDQSDLDRRQELADLTTASENAWFARAFVNRVWSEMLGEGFYSPIDDMGPDRDPQYPAVLAVLSEGFVASGHDIRWLFRTIANTNAYQREIRPSDTSEDTPAFAAATPMRLRADQLYSAITDVLGVDQFSQAGRGRGRGMYRGLRSPRNQFNELFGFDPSTAQADIVGTIPQALFLMNSPVIDRLIKGDRGTVLSHLLDEYENDEDAVNELYVRVLSREPSEQEMKICLDYRTSVESRSEAFEDLLWSLLNSSEFLSKR